MNAKAIVIFSGGLDSAAVLSQALTENKEVIALHFCYGSKHEEAETKAANSLIDFLNNRGDKVTMMTIDLSPVFKHFKSALLTGGEDLPHGTYDVENMKKTVVPFRNGIMLSIAAGIAESQGANRIYAGVHAGDNAVYPDCRVEFIKAFQDAVDKGTDAWIDFVMPLNSKPKSHAVNLCTKNKIPTELTWSCYEGGETQCGTCTTCTARREAFSDACIADKTIYMGDF